MPAPIDAVTVCGRAGGIARTADLLRAGVSPRSLSEAVRHGELLKPRQGVYALPSVPRATAEAIRHGGVVACATAGRAHGLWMLDAGADECVHVWVAPEHHERRHVGCGCRVHRDLAPDLSSGWRVGVLQCLLQILRCLGTEAFFAALESALRQRLLSRDGLRRLRDAVPSGIRWLVDFARSDADSGLESLVRLRLHSLGVSVRTQVRIGGVGIVDFVVGDCLILEIDGATHGGDHRHRDLVRDAIAMGLGFVTLRFDSAMVLHDWPTVESAVLAAVDRRLPLTAGPRPRA